MLTKGLAWGVPADSQATGFNPQDPAAFERLPIRNRMGGLEGNLWQLVPDASDSGPAEGENGNRVSHQSSRDLIISQTMTHAVTLRSKRATRFLALSAWNRLCTSRYYRQSAAHDRDQSTFTDSPTMVR